MNKPNTNGNGKDGWDKWGHFVVKELERLNEKAQRLDDKVSKVMIEIAMLKVKSGIWGLVGGAIPVAVGLAVWIIKG